MLEMLQSYLLAERALAKMEGDPVDLNREWRDIRDSLSLILEGQTFADQFPLQA